MWHNKENMTKLVIFDLDGTLIDTMEDIAGACNHALDVCGFPQRPLSDYNQLVGRGIYNLCKDALPEDVRNDEQAGKVYREFIPYYKEHICDKTRPYDGICEMFDVLEKAGISFAVASNKFQEGTEFLIDKLFGKYSFVSILGQREGKPIKPDPLIVSEAMAAMEGITKEEVVYCGDSDVDMMTGINAGVRTIGVTWGFRTREEIASYSPWKIVDKAEEISQTILSK